MQFSIWPKSIAELKEEAAREKAKAEQAREEIRYRKEINESKAIEKERDKIAFNDSAAGKTVKVLGAGFKGLGKVMRAGVQTLKDKKNKKSKPANKKYNRFKESNKTPNIEDSFLEKAFGKKQ